MLPYILMLFQEYSKHGKRGRFPKAKLLTQQVKKVYTDLTMVAAVANPLMDF